LSAFTAPTYGFSVQKFLIEHRWDEPLFTHLWRIAGHEEKKVAVQLQLPTPNTKADQHLSIRHKHAA
jgi:hypothetical protein